MSPDELMQAIKGSLREATEDIPDSYIAREPEEAYEDMSARFILALSRRGLYITDTGERDRRVRESRPKCTATMAGVGGCRLHLGHSGQHELLSGDKWG